MKQRKAKEMKETMSGHGREGKGNEREGKGNARHLRVGPCTQTKRADNDEGKARQQCQWQYMCVNAMLFYICTYGIIRKYTTLLYIGLSNVVVNVYTTMCTQCYYKIVSI